MSPRATPVSDVAKAAPPVSRQRHGLRLASTILQAWWAWPVLTFVVTRCASGIMIMLAQQHQVAITPDVVQAGYFAPHPTTAHPGYLGVASNWDAQWYWQIAEHGYPATIAVDASGRAERSAWAFPPLFPLVTRGLMTLTGLDFPSVAVAISISCALVGVLLVYRLIDETAGPAAARTTTLLLCTSMAAPVFQIGYTEGPALLLLAASIWQLRRGNYLRVALLLWGLSLTRHVLVPFVIVLVAHAVLHWREGTLTPTRRISLVSLGLSTVLAVAAWPVTVAVATGRLTGFTDTQAAWRKSTDVGPYGVFSVAWHLAGATGLAMASIAALAILFLTLRSGARAWSPEVRAWAAAYPLYLLAVAPAAVSLFRFFVLAFPLAWAFPDSRTQSKVRIVLVCTLAVGGLLAQWYWIRHFLVLGPVEEQFAMP